MRPLWILLLAFAVSARAEDVAQHLQKISVTISAEGSQGSGVTFIRDGVSYVWTAAHVIDGLRKTREVIDGKSGTKRLVVEFADAKVVRVFKQDGRDVGRSDFYAEVLRYSDADNGEDLALLRVRQKGFSEESVKFYLDEGIPPISTPLFHVGSLLGEQGSNSMTTGIMSQHGRLINKTVFDQTTCAAFPGSSGAGVYLTDGRYIGMLVRGAGETFNLIVPVRRMKDWAKKAGVLWAIDPSVPVPPEEVLSKMPVEDNGIEFTAERSVKDKEFGFMLRREE